MALNGGRLKETQVSLLLSSRAEMQKVIEAARQQTLSFMSFSADAAAQQLAEQKAVAAKQVAAQFAAQAAAAQLPKPQPPVITTSSLSGILAQQMFQQHQMQFMNQPNMANMMQQSSQAGVKMPVDINSASGLNLGRGVQSPPNVDRLGKTVDDHRRGSRSRSKSRERRSKRSRSRDRSSRRRRSRSSERRSSRRRRDRSRDRSTERIRGGSGRGRGRSSYDRDQSSSEPVKAPLQPANNTNDKNGGASNVSVWDNQANASQSANQQQPSSLHQPPPMDMFSAMGNVPMMNPLVQPPIGQFPFGSPPPMIPPPNQGSLPLGNNPKPMINSFPNAVPFQISSSFQGSAPFQAAPTFQSAGSFQSPPSAFPTNSVDTNDQRTTIRMVNIDASLHYSNIRKFFAGLHIPNDGIKIINDEFGKRRGEAVVRFARPFHAQEAVQKSGFEYNGTVMKIFLIDAEEYNKEVGLCITY